MQVNKAARHFVSTYKFPHGRQELDPNYSTTACQIVVFAGESTVRFPHQYGGGSRTISRAKIVCFEALETRRQNWCAEQRRIV